MAYKKIYFFVLVIQSVFFSASKASDEKDSAASYCKRAIQLRHIENPVEVLRLFEKAIAFDPNNLSARIEYADFLFDNLKHYQAIQQWKYILHQQPDHPVALLQLTRCSFMLRRWGDVIDFGSKIAASPGLNYFLGKAYFETEDYNLARQKLLAATKEDPRNLQAFTYLGKACIELDEYYAAINAYKNAMLLDSTNAFMQYEYGMLCYTLNDEKQAIFYWEKAAKNGYPVDLDYSENLGVAYLSVDVEKGVAILDKVLKKKPGNRNILMQIAHAWYRKHEFKLAAELYETAFNHDETNANALYMLGLTYIKRGNKPMGNELCEKAIKLDPSLKGMKRLSFMD